MVDKDKLLAAYAANISRADNPNQYLSYAQHFLKHATGLDRPAIDNYLDSLRQVYRPGTVNLRYRTIRRLYNVNNIPWPYRRGEGPQIKERDEYRPQLASSVVGAMILKARDGVLYPVEQCYVALSTTYGLRREEMASLRSKDIDLRHRAIYVATLKSGRERYHLIPDEIMPYIEAHDFDTVYAVSTVSVMFKRILLKSTGAKMKVKGLGWHSIRRALLEGLVRNGLNIFAARKFLRWKGSSGDMAMPSRYYGNVVVDMDSTAPVMDEAQQDEEVFEKHPFLPFWRDDA